MKQIGLFISAVAILFNAPFSVADEPYKEIQDSTIATISKLNKEIASRSVSATKISFNERELYYLNGVYLYCTLKNGTCPYILETILETDILNSQIDGKASCPHTLRFWQEWIDNSFEDRVNYNLGTGFLTKYQDFKKNIRPRYLRCSATVEREIKNNTPSNDYISARYAPSSEVAHNVKRTLAYLTAIREEVPEVFIATGAYKVAPKPSPSPKF
jgi:hypothetical protein